MSRSFLFVDTNGDQTTHTERQLRALLASRGLTSPAADDMPIDDVIHQVNEVNGDEVKIFELLEYRVEATLTRTLGTTTVWATSHTDARAKAEELEHGDFDQADNTELVVDDVYREFPHEGEG